MKLNDPLASEIVFDGKIFEMNLSFDNVLDVLDEIADERLFDWEKGVLISSGIVGNTDLSEEKEALLGFQILNDFIYVGQNVKSAVEDLEGNLMPLPPKKSKKVIDLVQDAKYIYASFRQIGINLFEEQGKMHWEEFQAILESLPDDTILPKIIQIREWTPSKNDSAKERERMRELQAKYSLEMGVD